MTPPESEGGLDGADAMADLILGTTGILLVLLVTLGPAALSRQVAPAEDDAPALPTGLAVEGHSGPILLAGAEGLFVSPGGRMIPVSEIATSPQLAALGPARPLLIIRPDGIEAAFHASARLAAAGSDVIDRVRVDRACAEVRRVERRDAALVLVCRGR